MYAILAIDKIFKITYKNTTLMEVVLSESAVVDVINCSISCNASVV